MLWQGLTKWFCGPYMPTDQTFPPLMYKDIETRGMVQLENCKYNTRYVPFIRTRQNVKPGRIDKQQMTLERELRRGFWIALHTILGNLGLISKILSIQELHANFYLRENIPTMTLGWRASRLSDTLF